MQRGKDSDLMTSSSDWEVYFEEDGNRQRLLKMTSRYKTMYISCRYDYANPAFYVSRTLLSFLSSTGVLDRYRKL